MKKVKIKVRVDWWDGGGADHIEVDAYVVGGEGGVFASYLVDRGDGVKLVGFAAGDDGNWWEIHRTHADWCPAIAQMVMAASAEAAILNGDRK